MANKPRSSRKAKRKGGKKRSRFVPLMAPASHMVRMRYGLVDSITSTAGALATQTYQANGLYDVDFTGIGHQPRSFDEWMTFYDHYCVVYSKIYVKLAYTTAGTNSMWCSVRLSDATTSPATYEDLQESKYVKQAVLTPNSGTRTFSLACNMKKFLGVNSIIGQSQFRGTSNTNPSEEATWQVNAGDIASGTTTLGIYGYIEYYVVLTEQKLMAQS